MYNSIGAAFRVIQEIYIIVFLFLLKLANHIHGHFDIKIEHLQLAS